MTSPSEGHPGAGCGVGWGAAEIIGGRQSSVNKGRRVPAALRPRGPGWCAGHALFQGQKDWPGREASEYTSGFAPGFGNGVPIGWAGTEIFILTLSCIFKSTG